MAIQSNRPNNRIVLIIGVLLAAVTAFLIIFLFKSTGGGSTTSAVIAKAPITAGSAITADQLTNADIPANLLPSDYIADPANIIGKQLIADVQPNTPITTALIASATNTASAGPSALPQITKDYVAMAIPTSGTIATPATSPVTFTGMSTELTSLGFYIQPGDHIDILVDDGNISYVNQGGQIVVVPANDVVHFGFQDVRVLRTGTAGSAGGSPAVYIVELPRAQAELLTYMITRNANLSESTNPATFVAPPRLPFILKYVLRPKSEWGDPTNVGKDDSGKTIPADGAHPYANYLPICPFVQDSSGNNKPPAPGTYCATPYTLPQAPSAPGKNESNAGVPDSGANANNLAALFP